MSIKEALQERILVIDGAMGTMVQRHKLTEEDFRGTRFANWHTDVKGNNDLLCITQPAIVTGIHLQYLEVHFGNFCFQDCSINSLDNNFVSDP